MKNRKRNVQIKFWVTKEESSLILYETATKVLKESGITKLPDMAALKTEYAELQAQKEALYADYGKLKKQIREYEVIKRNIDSLLQKESLNKKPLTAS